jgi:DNA-binding GntR family transcriptional regulator
MAEGKAGGETRSIEFDASEVRSIRDLVYESLRKAIFDGNLKPGDRLVEIALAQELNVSRTPVREALRKLETEGLVEAVPRKGVIVRGFDPEDILEVYTIRMALEKVAAVRTARRITSEELEELQDHLDRAAEWSARADRDEPGACAEVFEAHQRFTDGLVRASRMPRLIGLIETYREYLERFRRVTLSGSERRLRVQREHQAILDAVRRKDREALERLVQEHLEGAEASYLGAFGYGTEAPGADAPDIAKGGGN